MPILNRANDGMLSLLIPLFRCLQSQGPMLRAELLALCAPAGAPFRAAEPLTRTLNTWLNLGLFCRAAGVDDQTLELATEFESITDPTGREFRCRLRSLVLSETNNSDLTAFGGAADLTRALAWLLAEDVYALPDKGAGIIARDASRFGSTDSSPFRNNMANWPTFPEWAVFLGFGWYGATGLTLDPTGAVRDCLGDIFGGRQQLGIGEFVRRLGACLPVLDAGRIRTAVLGQIPNWSPYGEPDLSVGLSRALIRLTPTHLTLDRRADAPRTMRILGRARRVLGQVTHVQRMEVST